MTKTNSRGIDFGTGADQVSARSIPANFTPTTYTPDDIAAEGNDKISAHLRGIDQYLGTVSGGGSERVFILDPSVSPSGNTYSSMSDLLSAGAAYPGNKKILINNSESPETPITVGSGTYDFSEYSIEYYRESDVFLGFGISFDSGTTLTGFFREHNVGLVFNNTVNPVMELSSVLHISAGYFGQISNQGSEPVFRINTGSNVLFSIFTIAPPFDAGSEIFEISGGVLIWYVMSKASAAHLNNTPNVFKGSSGNVNIAMLTGDEYTEENINWSGPPPTVSVYQYRHAIENDGSPVANRPVMNFTGAGVSVTDLGGKTVVDIPGGGGGPLTVVQANGETINLTGLSASTADDNIVAGLPTGHGMEVGDIIEFSQTLTVQFINYRTYARRVIEIQDDLFNYIQETDVVPVGISGTYDLEITVDGGSPTNVSFTVTGGTDTWANVVSAITSGLSTAGLNATAYFNSPSTLWAGGVSNAQAGILIRSNTFGTGSAVNSISNGLSNDFFAALGSVSYSTNTNSDDSTGANFDLALSPGFTFSAITYSVSGPIYNGSFTVISPVFPGVAIIQPLTPDLFTNGYTTQNSADLSAATANHTMPGTNVSGTVTVTNVNDVTYSGTPVTVATIPTIDVIKKHYINNGNIGIGTQNPQYPFDVVADLYYKGSRFKKCNFTASAAPISSDDTTQGYEIDSLWVYNGLVYVCTDASSGSAVWNEIGVGGVTSVNGDSGPAVTLTTDNINEGASNFYYSETRFNNSLSTKTTDDLGEGTTNLYFSGKTTDNLPEGTTNLYFSGKDTDDLVEGITNKYVTQAQKNEFHTNHANRSSLDYLQITSPSNGELLTYDSNVSKVVNTNATDILSPTIVNQYQYLNSLDYSNTYEKRNYPLSYNRNSSLFRAASVGYDPIIFADNDYIFHRTSSIPQIRTKITNIVAASVGLSFTTQSDVIKIARDTFIVSGKLVKLSRTSVKILGSITQPSGTLMLAVMRENQTFQLGDVSPVMSLVYIEGNGTASPVFKSYDVNFSSSTVNLVSTVNYSSLVEYNALYTDVSYLWDQQGIVTYPTDTNNYYQLKFRLAATGYDGSVVQCWAREVQIQTLSGSLTFPASINGKVTTTAGIPPTQHYFSHDLLLLNSGSQTLVYSYQSLVSNTFQTLSYNSKSPPIPFPTSDYPRGYAVLTNLGSNYGISYIDSISLQEISYKVMSSPNLSSPSLNTYAVIDENYRSVIAFVTTDLFIAGERELEIGEYAIQTSTLFAHTAAGYGSTATKIPYFSTLEENSPNNRFTVVNNSTDGLSITIRVKGVYAVTYWYDASAAEHGGISLNASSTSTDITSLNAAQRVQLDRTAAAGIINVSTEISLDVGDVIRPHNTGISAGTAAYCGFRIEFIRPAAKK